MGSKKQKRIERRHFKEIRNNRKRREEVGKELQEWKEKTCDLPEVGCYADQLREFSGQIFRDDCVYAMDPNGNQVFLSGTVDRLPKDKLTEALGYRDRLHALDKQLVEKLDGYADIYNTFPDLIDPSTGVVTEAEILTVAAASEPAEETKDGEDEGPQSLGTE